MSLLEVHASTVDKHWTWMGVHLASIIKRHLRPRDFMQGSSFTHKTYGAMDGAGDQKGAQPSACEWLCSNPGLFVWKHSLMIAQVSPIGCCARALTHLYCWVPRLNLLVIGWRRPAVTLSLAAGKSSQRALFWDSIRKDHSGF